MSDRKLPLVCRLKWEELPPGRRSGGRDCSQCHTTVWDLTHMTLEELQATVAFHGNETCAFVRRNDDGLPRMLLNAENARKVGHDQTKCPICQPSSTAERASSVPATDAAQAVRLAGVAEIARRSPRLAMHVSDNLCAAFEGPGGLFAAYQIPQFSKDFPSSFCICTADEGRSVALITGRGQPSSLSTMKSMNSLDENSLY